jgi:hypothetical protein
MVTHIHTQPQPDVLIDPLERYLQASFRESPEMAVDVLHPALIARRGGRRATIERLQQEYRLQRSTSLFPRSITFGAPMIFNDAQKRFAWVPVRSVTPGFPNDIVASGLYAVVSTDGGRNWYVFVPTCGEEEWIRSTFPGYPYGQESVKFREIGRTIAP